MEQKVIKNMQLCKIFKKIQLFKKGAAYFQETILLGAPLTRMQEATEMSKSHKGPDCDRRSGPSPSDRRGSSGVCCRLLSASVS